MSMVVMVVMSMVVISMVVMIVVPVHMNCVGLNVFAGKHALHCGGEKDRLQNLRREKTVDV